MIIREVEADDAGAIAGLYAHHVRTGLGTFEISPPSPEEMAARAQAVQRRGLPFFVAQHGPLIVGFAYAAPFRDRAAYDFTAEDSVYVDPAAQNQGVGRALLNAVIQTCGRLGLRRLIALIGDSANAGSISLHTSLGFKSAGVVSGAGWKHGRWVDLVIMERAIGDGAQTPPPPHSP